MSEELKPKEVTEVSRNTKRSSKQKKKGLDAPVKLKILVTIVPRNKNDVYISLFESFDVNYQSMIYAKGTAPTEVLDKLGLQSNDKVVILSAVREDRIQNMLNILEEKYFTKKSLRGVAFTLPMDSIIGVYLYQFLSNLGDEDYEE